MSAPDCVFCRIVAGQVPAHVIFDHPACLAFLDINPLAHGHTLVIPKVHVGSLPEAPPEVVAALTSNLPRIARAVESVTGCTGLNLLQNSGASAGQVVPHLHFHLIPRREGDSLGYRWNAGAYPAGRAESLRAQLLDALRV